MRAAFHGRVRIVYVLVLLASFFLPEACDKGNRANVSQKLTITGQITQPKALETNSENDTSRQFGINAPKVETLLSVPEPPFSIRSSTIGAIEAFRPEFFQQGKPKRIEYQGWNLVRQSEGVARIEVPRTAGVREFDRLGRVTGVGTWSDGAVTISRFEHDRNGIVRRMRATRGEIDLPGSIKYKYRSNTASIQVSSIQERTEEVVRTEIQIYDNSGRMVEDRIESLHSGIRYSFRYNSNNNLVEISCFILSNLPALSSNNEPSEQWRFEYDEQGRVIKSTKLTQTSKGLTGTPVSYEYDKNGNIVSSTYGEGKSADVVEYTYEFDDHGNWIRQTGWPVTDDPNATGYEIERSITYYE